MINWFMQKLQNGVQYSLLVVRTQSRGMTDKHLSQSCKSGRVRAEFGPDTCFEF